MDKIGVVENDQSGDFPVVRAWKTKSGYIACIRYCRQLGVYNGYVAVPKHHRAYGLDYTHELLDSIDVHGSLTFARGTGDYWAFGFDTAHVDDVPPHGRPKDEVYVHAQCEQLSEQLRELDGTESFISRVMRKLLL